MREGVILNKDTIKNSGPGAYQPNLPQDIQKVVATRNIKS